MARDFSRFFENEVIRDSVITAIVLFLRMQKTNKSQWQYFVIVQKAPAFHASLLRPAETERDRCKFWSSVLKRLKVTFLFTFLTTWVLHVSVSVLKCLLLRGQLKKLHL